MLETSPRAFWDDVADRLRPFIARRVGRPEDVDDVLQDVFVRVQRGLASIRHEDRLRAWLFQITRSAIAEHLRARARHPLADSPEAAEQPTPIEGDQDEILDGGLTACLARFVAELPSPYREAITLTELQGVSQADAAAMLGLSIPGMKSRVQRGRARLRRLFEDCCEVTLDRRRRVVSCEPRHGACDCA
jgi:RNA polymerase sigma-70 factor (ECF subfamily)